MNQAPNLGLSNQQRTQEAYDQNQEIRNVPSELKSRPKIPRTPADGDNRDKND
jgi:hypothetical protein